MQNEWDVLGKIDPLWAILSDPERQFSRWGEEEFFATGQEYVAHLLTDLRNLHLPLVRNTALDFGCGVGRIVRPLSNHFVRVVGLDCSRSMIASAKLKNRHLSNCEFVECSDRKLPFPDSYFDLVHTVIVLQHLRKQADVLTYIHEFMRILRPGGIIVFQVPTLIPIRKRIQLKRRLWSILFRFGASEEFLYNQLGLHPIRMIAVPRDKLISVITNAGCGVVRVKVNDGYAGPSVFSNTYFVAKPIGSQAGM